MSEIKLSDLIVDPELRISRGPDIDQRQASTPTRHVWVRASAGSGKTKVLIDRLLRLLLPDPDTNAPGVAPDKILCLTFTKAGAAEMSLRLQKRLLEWSAAKDTDLQENLRDLIGREPSDDFLREAKRLLARVLDAPSRLRILTIHSFCQSVLGRFPVETGLSPDFKVIEEAEASEYLKNALHEILAFSASHRESDLGQVFSRLSIIKNMDQLQSELKSLINEPVRLQDFTTGLNSLSDIRRKIAAAFSIQNLDDMSNGAFCEEATLPRATLMAMADILGRSTKLDQVKSEIIFNWLSAGQNERLRTLAAYQKAVSAAPRGKFAKDSTEFLECQQREIDRIEKCRLASNINSTADLLFLASHILKAYDRYKRFLGVLDYNDLIFYTRRLLLGEFSKGDNRNSARQSAEWVLYKLDEGIDHMLVDESQDTNPDQWRIVQQLSEEYFSGAARPVDRPRTLFVVGDEKQSIFSFQRADPAEFHRMRDYFQSKSEALQQGFEESLIYSFRSTTPVLKLTDAVFDDPTLLHHIGIKNGEKLRHISHRSDNRKDLSGSVELWPAILEEKKPPAPAGWNLPLGDPSNFKSAQERLARRIAQRIGEMIRKREARAEDFMILMRTRSPLMLHIIRELKLSGLPVSGLDRMVLSESLIIQDILAVCDFVLLPENDFALGCLLKSPFVGFSEDQLMELCLSKAKKQSLWLHLKEDGKHPFLSTWLSRLIAYAHAVQPYEFLDSLMTLPCPADEAGSGYRACQRRLGEDSLEPIDEFLGEALKMEMQNIRTLQDFSSRQRSARREVRREMEEGAGQIRIMTVHASKGLEAPIVILPDTTSLPDKRQLSQFVWPDKTSPSNGLLAPLWCGSGNERSKRHKDAVDTSYQLQIEEYSRLLYVAMTRARDRLIICGAAKQEPKPDSWYGMVRTGFERLGETRIENDIKIFSLTNDSPERQEKTAEPLSPVPEWARQSARPETEALASFTPSSEGSEQDDRIYSPLEASFENRFRRGLATHKLLQILPDLKIEKREVAARNFLRTQNLSQEMRDSILSETLQILSDPVFAPVFGPSSLAEVAVTGDLGNGRLINGQIDRLVVTETEILIVDFKTNRPSPVEIQDIPPSYRGQLKAYADALKLIYPGRAIRTALLWTDKPQLMEVSF